MMQILAPSGLHRMSATVLFARLLIISSYQAPSLQTQTMIIPEVSAEVSLSYREFQRTIITGDVWPVRFCIQGVGYGVTG